MKLVDQILKWYSWKTMDPKSKTSYCAASGTFSESDYTSNPRVVVAHAAAHGSATVVAADGRPLVFIDIPTTDLPTFEE